jgi:hypothetical protein
VDRRYTAAATGDGLGTGRRRRSLARAEKLKDAEQEATGHVVEKDVNKEIQGATGSAAAAEKLDSDPREHTVVQDNETAHGTRSEETQSAGVKTAAGENDDAHGEIQTAETRDTAAEQLASDPQEKDTTQDHDAPTTQLQNMLEEEYEKIKNKK